MAKRKKNITKEDLKGDSLTAAPLSSKQGHYYDLGLSGMGTMFGGRSMYGTGGDLTNPQIAGLQIANGLAQTGGEALQGMETVDGRPRLGADIGGGALKGAGTGASLGATLGTFVLPGIGTAAGAGVGAAVGAVGGALGGLVKGKREISDYDAAAAQARAMELQQGNLAMMSQSVPGVDTSGNYLKYGGKMKANVEIEGGEMVQFKEGGLAQVMNRGGELNQMSSGMYKADGQSHNNGGIKIATDEGRVFSAMTPKGEKMSPAQKAEEVSAQLKAFEERAEKGGKFSENTLKYMKKGLDAKLDSVYKEQEDRKAAKAEKEFKKGGWMKYYDGGTMGQSLPEGVDRMFLAENYGIPMTLTDEEAVKMLNLQQDPNSSTFLSNTDSSDFTPNNPLTLDVQGANTFSIQDPFGNQGPLKKSLTENEKWAAEADRRQALYDSTPESMNAMSQIQRNPMADPAGSDQIEKLDEIYNPSEFNTADDTEQDPYARANMLNMAGALPGMGYNLGKGLFGKADRLNLDRLSPQNFEQMKRLAAQSEVYNPAAELSAAQSAAGAARKRMSDSAGGDLGAMMRGNLASQNMESSAKSGILGRAEQVNISARDAARQRMMGVLGQQMQDANRVNLFNMQQREKENTYANAADAAQQQYMNAFYSQLGALGKGLGQTELYKEQLKAIKKS